MGQTLTHGVYLPDEGERNCYSGLAANWQILDTSVGTIAEHTTQIAGKAPAVHTHTKSDVTDLFNSANTWSALNSYSNGQIRIKSQNQEIGVTPSGSVIQYLEFADKNDAQHGIVGLWDYANGASEIQMYISDKFKNGAKDPTGTTETTILSFGFKTDGSKFLTFSGQVDNSVIPKTNNTYDLGSSSYQWNNVYSKRVNTQTLNGVNPGALSLPSGDSVNIDTTNWNFSWGTNYVTAPFDGYISIACFGSALQINNETKSYVMTFAPGTDGFICGLLPVGSGDSIKVLVTRTQTSQYEGYKFIKSRGNVS